MASHHPEVGGAELCVALGHHRRIFDHVSPLIRQSTKLVSYDLLNFCFVAFCMDYIFSCCFKCLS